MTMLSMAMLYL